MGSRLQSQPPLTPYDVLEPIALKVLDLDAPKVAAQLQDLATEPADRVLVGVARGELSDEQVQLSRQLDLTFASGGSGVTWVDPGPGDLESIAATLKEAPQAAGVLARLLRLNEQACVTDGLFTESLAYSTLLGGGEFLRWRSSTQRRSAAGSDQPVLVTLTTRTLTVTLNRPERHNAFSRAVRDGLIEALAILEADASLEGVVRGNGPSFCSGGDLDEFGSAEDLALAHRVRTAASAGAAVHRCRHRLRFELHGSCIGAGIEVPAFADTVLASPGTTFMLPELAFGLVPGAGGTVSVPARIGRWRTAYLALTRRTVDAEQALTWGLVDGIA